MRLTPKDKLIHSQALQYAHAYRSAELGLVQVLLQVEDSKVHLKLGCTSLFRYVTDQLHLSESTAYSLSAIARKTREIPELKAALDQGKISLYKAGRVLPALTKANAPELLTFASENNTRATEKFVAKLKRVQSLRASRNQSSSFEGTLEAALDAYLIKHDPLARAQRAKVKVRARGKSGVAPSVKDKGPETASIKGEAFFKAVQSSPRPGRVPLTGRAEARGLSPRSRPMHAR